jgi:hypothetical protein
VFKLVAFSDQDGRGEPDLSILTLNGKEYGSLALAVAAIQDKHGFGRHCIGGEPPELSIWLDSEKLREEVVNDDDDIGVSPADDWDFDIGGYRLEEFADPKSRDRPPVSIPDLIKSVQETQASAVAILERAIATLRAGSTEISALAHLQVWNRYLNGD